MIAQQAVPILNLRHIKPKSFKYVTLNLTLSQIYPHKKIQIWGLKCRIYESVGFKISWLKMQGIMCPEYKITGFFKVLSS